MKTRSRARNPGRNQRTGWAPTHVQRITGHLPQRGRGQQESDQDEQTDVDAVDQPGDHKHGKHRTEPARRHHPSGIEHRVIHQHLHHRWQQR
jgi:hypothetical protein